MIPDSVARASSADEVSELVRECASEGTKITPAGSQTSMTARIDHRQGRTARTRRNESRSGRRRREQRLRALNRA